MESLNKDITIRRLQEYIRSKDCKPGLEHGYFMKLVEEVGELAEVIRKDRRLGEDDDIKGTIAEELYDVLYYVLALANLYNVDLEKSCLLKEEINKKRTDQNTR
jgi:NTP pyrophosphatase (non-canonical NTP hydrolase)